MRGASETVLAIALPAGTALLALAAWQAFTRLGHIPSVLLPAPTEIAWDFIAGAPELLYHALMTGYQIVLAFLLATVLGFLIAAVLAYSPFLKEMLYPNLVLFQLIPKIALAPLFVVWLGIDAPSRLAFATFISFFPVLISTAAGLEHTDANAVRLCRSLSASDWQVFTDVRVPFALPYFFNGVKIAATMAITGVVVGEFISAKSGLGFLILYSSSRMETARIFAGIAMLCIVGLSLFGLVVLLERKARRWYRG
jgi:NitT/TauT family transport system permease protein